MSQSNFKPIKFPLWPGVAILVIVYTVGLIGLSIEDTRELFQDLTPFNLVVSALILFAYHRDWNKRFLWWVATVFAIGFSVEVLGVHTGIVFGQYVYGETLGPKAFEVPLVIGLNWLILTYAAGSITRQLPSVRLVRALLAALLMVFLDLVLEPVAMSLDFWQWDRGEIPILNYVMWFVVSMVMQVTFHLGRFSKSNKIAPALYIVMLLFFTILALSL